MEEKKNILEPFITYLPKKGQFFFVLLMSAMMYSVVHYAVLNERGGRWILVSVALVMAYPYFVQVRKLFINYPALVIDDVGIICQKLVMEWQYIDRIMYVAIDRHTRKYHRLNIYMKDLAPLEKQKKNVVMAVAVKEWKGNPIVLTANHMGVDGKVAYEEAMKRWPGKGR